MNVLPPTDRYHIILLIVELMNENENQHHPNRFLILVPHFLQLLKPLILALYRQNNVDHLLAQLIVIHRTHLLKKQYENFVIR